MAHPGTLGGVLLITGGVNTGKGLLAKELGARLCVPVRATDELLCDRTRAGWEAVTAGVVRWIMRGEPCVIKGVRVPHALLMMNRLHPEAPTPQPIVYLTRALVPLTPRQEAMDKSIRTVMHTVQRVLKPRVLFTTYRPELQEEIMRCLREPC